MVLERPRVPDNLEHMELLAQKLRLAFFFFFDLPLICRNLDLTFTGLVSVLHVCSVDVNDPKTDPMSSPRF